MSFNDFSFHQKISAGIKACGYQTPTPIQKKAIGPVLAGRDLMGLAQTGTGKTAAFALPTLEKLVNGPRRKIRALVIAPTRELAEQINDNFKKLGRRTGLRTVSVYGGVSKFGQIKAFRSGVEIVVACPGRLLDHLDSGDINLSHVDTLILDEADMMFDMGFLPTIKRIIKRLPKNRQNLLFSATMPREIRGLAVEILNDPEVIQIDHSRPVESVSHTLYRVEKKHKSHLLRQIIHEDAPASILIFTRTKYGAKNLAARLARDGHRATSIQGNLSQNKRQQALDGFKSGKFNIMVATDIAARGIDVSGISHVINFDTPATVEAYTHRIGRTGRADQTGTAVTFADREEMRIVRGIEKTLAGRMVHKEFKAGKGPVNEIDIEQRGDRRPAHQSKRPSRPANRESRGGNGPAKSASFRKGRGNSGGSRKPRSRRSAPLGVSSFTNRDRFKKSGAGKAA